MEPLTPEAREKIHARYPDAAKDLAEYERLIVAKSQRVGLPVDLVSASRIQQLYTKLFA